MRIIAKRTLREFWVIDSDSEQPLKAWHQEAARADWSNPAEVKAQCRNVFTVGDRVVFNIAGNKYRLVAWINYPHRIVYVKFIGTHKDYDKIDVRTV
ncbi:MAG: type II toxin-antitoxin system HigB family toxin [Alphaproteobacteria bacterium]|nr:type II toxin-antitoxin system HigB family toxin [Alphaproteobacteria bacterium]